MRRAAARGASGVTETGFQGRVTEASLGAEPGDQSRDRSRRLQMQLAIEHLGADAVLAERLAGVPFREMGADQGAVRTLA